MGFDINKYDGTRFHSDDLINKRIIALMLWYEHKVLTEELDGIETILLLDTLIEGLVKREWYEIAEFFKGVLDDYGKK